MAALQMCISTAEVSRSPKIIIMMDRVAPGRLPKIHPPPRWHSPHYITFYIVERKSSSSIFCQLNCYLSRVMMTRLMRCWCTQKKRKTSKQCTYSNDMTATVPVQWPPPTTTWASNQIYYETKPETHLNSETGWPSTTTQQQYSFGSYN